MKVDVWIHNEYRRPMIKKSVGVKNSEMIVHYGSIDHTDVKLWYKYNNYHTSGKTDGVAAHICSAYL